MTDPVYRRKQRERRAEFLYTKVAKDAKGGVTNEETLNVEALAFTGLMKQSA